MRAGFNFINAAVAEWIRSFSKTVRTFVFAKFDSNQVATELVTLPLWDDSNIRFLFLKVVILSEV